MARSVWLYPESQERQYQRFFLRLIRELNSEMIKRLLAIRIIRKDDEDEAWSDELELEVSILIAWWLGKVQELQVEIQKNFQAVSLFNDKQFRLSIRSAFGVSLPSSQTLAHNPGELTTPYLVARNALGETADIARAEGYIELMRKNFLASGSTIMDRMGRDFIEITARDIRRQMVQGNGVNVISDSILQAIKNRAATLENQALLAARDEVSILNGELSMRRQKSVNVADYIWHTRRDERVRPAHKALEGSRQLWSKAPNTGHPGMSYRCRCWAEPIRPN